MEEKRAGKVSAVRQTHGTETEFCLPQGHESDGQGSRREGSQAALSGSSCLQPHVRDAENLMGAEAVFQLPLIFSLLTIASLCCLGAVTFQNISTPILTCK